jgi:hypothetical protein
MALTTNLVNDLLATLALMAAFQRRNFRPFIGPYCAIYPVIEGRVVYLIADGWRDPQALLGRRLLRA